MARIIIAILLLSISTAHAGNLISSNIEGADVILWEKWKTSVEHMRFPMLPEPSKVKFTKKSFDDKQRYILHIATSGINAKKKKKYENNWLIRYRVKDDSYILIVHPDYLQCLENAQKKFQYMQWVVVAFEKVQKEKFILLEQPRQCIGNYKLTGGKLDKPL